MTEIILGSVILALLATIVYERNENKKERAKLINALMAKTPEQFRDLELAEKVKPIEPPKKTEPDLVEIKDLSDKQFDEMIKKEIS